MVMIGGNLRHYFVNCSIQICITCNISNPYKNYRVVQGFGSISIDFRRVMLYVLEYVCSCFVSSQTCLHFFHFPL